MILEIKQIDLFEITFKFDYWFEIIQINKQTKQNANKNESLHSIERA